VKIVGVLAAAAVACSVAVAPAATSRPKGPPGFAWLATGPHGGNVIQGWIPNPAVPHAFRPTVVYLPPGYDPHRRYPAIYLLQGFPGSPYQFVDGVRLLPYADNQIASGALSPFLAVAAPAGIDVHHGDWTGVWERYLTDVVVPWADAHLPTIASRTGRIIAGLSSGGYLFHQRTPPLRRLRHRHALSRRARGRRPSRPPPLLTSAVECSEGAIATDPRLTQPRKAASTPARVIR
jgi:hypothetical protein